MVYPADPPTAKHDLISAANVSVSRMEPTLSPRELVGNGTSTSFPKKISTIYTYKDAPTRPKPMSKALPICGFCSLDSIGVSSTFMAPEMSGLKTCRIGVKRADEKYKRMLPPDALANSNNFALLIQQLRRNDKSAYFVCPTTERAGFIVPMDDSFDGSDYAAYCLVGSLDDVRKCIENIGEGNGQDQPMDEGIQNSNGYEEPNQDSGLWKPPSANEDSNSGNFGEDNLWTPSTPPVDNQADAFYSSVNDDAYHEQHPNGDAEDGEDHEMNGNEFHDNIGAAAADKFYSNLTRSLDTRADSILYHMRNFNGWVKATQIAELNPITINSNDTNASKKRKRTNHPLRVLDLACGKGGDLGKWVLHKRGIGNYVGVDVARGSLVDAAVRVRKMRNLDKCVFTCADLGSDVPGRIKSKHFKKMQKLLSWSLESDDGMGDPQFRRVRGGGIKETDKFDVVSIQFAIHYMMQTKQRARRFFHTVSQLLEIGGNLIATTIDARKVMEHMMNTGYDFRFIDGESDPDNEKLVVSVGEDACQLKFHRDIVKKIFHSNKKYDGHDGLNPDHFGLEYTFTLTEGKDHAVGVGQAVDLPEWLIPLPVMKALGAEAGLAVDYASNFHEFYSHRKDPIAHHAAHGALYNMKVLNRSGTISDQEWEISSMYMAIKFRKERESTIDVDVDCDNGAEQGDDESSDEEMETRKDPAEVSSNSMDVKKKDAKESQKLFLMAMSKAKKAYGDGWKDLNSDERKAKTNEFMASLTTSEWD